MSSDLPIEIITQIIDNVGENEDTNLLKELSLVSHSFHQICSKHLFATVDLYDEYNPMRRPASSKKGFIKLLKSRPDVVKHIRKLTYNVKYTHEDEGRQSDDFLLSPILPDLLRTISRLNCLRINASKMNWNTLDSSLTSALLYLMHLPSVSHIDLSFIRNFPLSSLLPSVNLLRLDIFHLCRHNQLEEDGPSEIVVQSEIMPKIREFRTSDSTVLTRKLLHAERQDGRPAFNFMDLRQVSMDFDRPEDEANIRYMLQNAKLLEKFDLTVGHNWILVGLRDILSPSARNLKVLDFTVSLYVRSVSLPLAGLCRELEAIAGHNMLEALSFKINADGHESEDFVGTIIQDVEKVLVKPGWSALKRVSFKVSIACCLVSREDSAALSEALQSLPDKYLSHLPKLESLAFNYSAYVVKCAYES